MAELLLLGLVSFLHDLFTAMWIGGMIVLGFVILPTIKKTMGLGPETKKLTEAIRNQLSKLTYLSMIGLLITGILLSRSSPLYLGPLSIGNEYSAWLAIKHIMIALMVLISIFRSLVVPKRTMPEPKKMKLNALLLILNIVLGVGVLLLSGFIAAANVVYLSTP
ncbi:MAG: hypothetical protein RTU09_02330 [Candidatus Thorarchaeota archaeon]